MVHANFARYEILSAMKNAEDFWFGKGEMFKAWPGSRKEIEKFMDHAKSLYEMCKAFFEVNFPDHDARAKFRCFDNGPTALPQEVRLTMMESIAKREGCCPTRTRMEFNAMLPHCSELYVACQDHKRVAIDLMEMCRTKSGTFRKDRENFIKCALTYVGLNDLTTDCERTLSRVAALESGERSAHLKFQLLSDSMMVSLHVPRQIDALVWRDSSHASGGGATVAKESWRPKEFITTSKKKYKEFFGGRRLACRIASKVVPTQKPIKIRRLASIDECELKQKTRCKYSKKRMCETHGAAKQRWRQAVQRLTNDMKAGKPRPSTTAIGTNMPSMDKKRNVHPHVKATMKKLDELKESSKNEAIEQQMSHGLPRPPKALDPPRKLKPTWKTQQDADWEGMKFWKKSRAFAKQRAKNAISNDGSEEVNAKRQRLEVATKPKHEEHECATAEFAP